MRAAAPDSTAIRAAIAALFVIATAGVVGQAQSPAAANTARVAGCVLEQASFAAAAGLGQVTASASGMQLVLVQGSLSSPYNGRAFVLTGTRERDVEPYVGSHVEVTGALEAAGPVSSVIAQPPRPPQSETPASGASGVTPGGNPSHEPGDTAPGSLDPARTPAARTSAAAAASIEELPRLNVMSVRQLAEPSHACADLAATPRRDSRAGRADATSPAGPSGTAARATDAEGKSPATESPARVPPAALAGPVQVVGCLVRYVETGGARSPAEPDGRLAVTVADVTAQGPVRPAAVPGSSPSGAGSGTVAAARDAGVASPRLMEGAAFFVEGAPALAEAVGRRVTMVGTLQELPQASRARDGHATAPAATLTVASFTVVGGACR